MPVRATKRGPERSPLSGSADVIVCGASFAGLAVARELAGSGADVLVLDRYEIGERQTSACAAPTAWIEGLGLKRTILQTFGSLVIHLPETTLRWELPWTFSTFDYRELCLGLWEQCGDARFETAVVTGRAPGTGEAFVLGTDRGDLTSSLLVDALGWRRVLSTARKPVQPPRATLSRGLEVHPPASGDELELWLDPRYVRRGYAWSFPAADEVRVGIGSFDPRDHVREPTVRLAQDLGLDPAGYQGNWIPHRMREPVDEGVFFVGDSAGHCLPATAEGIRPALHFGAICGRELRMVLDGRQSRGQALDRYTAACEDKRYAYRSMLLAQRFVGRANPHPLLTGVLQALGHPGFVTRAFSRYGAICPPPVTPARAR
jgi:flavin-dependent dehydrogenase